jgi:hypothetical protein
LIKKRGWRSFKAISYFPDEKFWPLLERYANGINNLDFYLAVASFKNEKAALILLERFYELNKLGNISSIEKLDEALMTHYDDVYRDLILMIWEKYKFMNVAMIPKLMAKDPQAATPSFAGGLLQETPIKSIWTENNGYYSRDTILAKMLYAIKQYEGDRLLEVCKFNLDILDFTELEEILNFIKENKLPGFDTLLLGKLNRQNIPYDFYNLTKLLFSYKDPELQRRTIEILQSRRAEWDKGNWTGRFKALFAEYKIEI